MQFRAVRFSRGIEPGLVIEAAVAVGISLPESKAIASGRCTILYGNGFTRTAPSGKQIFSGSSLLLCAYAPRLYALTLLVKARFGPRLIGGFRKEGALWRGTNTPAKSTLPS